MGARALERQRRIGAIGNLDVCRGEEDTHATSLSGWPRRLAEAGRGSGYDWSIHQSVLTFDCVL